MRVWCGLAFWAAGMRGGSRINWGLEMVQGSRGQRRVQRIGRFQGTRTVDERVEQSVARVYEECEMVIRVAL